jgi:hypothetical protein
LVLSEDHQPSLSIEVQRQPVQVRGNVFDSKGNPIEGAHVSVAGYPEFATTERAGVFMLQSQFSDGEAVELVIEKNGYVTAHQQHIVGTSVADIRLQKHR